MTLFCFVICLRSGFRLFLYSLMVLPRKGGRWGDVVYFVHLETGLQWGLVRGNVT